MKIRVINIYSNLGEKAKSIKCKNKNKWACPGDKSGPHAIFTYKVLMGHSFTYCLWLLSDHNRIQ